MDNRKDQIAGYIYTMQAFVVWGLLPMFWKLLQKVPAIEILAHRILWSFVFLYVWMVFRKKQKIFGLLKQRQTRNSLLITSLLVAGNWGLYIYAVNTNQIVEASLGYFITPLINILLGMLILKEKLDHLKLTALIIASVAVIYLTVDYGHFPWMSLYLATSFGFYGLIKKTAGIEAMAALTVETFLLLPLMIIFIGFKMVDGSGFLFNDSLFTDILLILSGIISSLPLYWFAFGAQRIPLTSVGFMQYLCPTLMLLVGIFVYNEDFRYEQSIAFGLIWGALALYSLSMWQSARKGIAQSKLAAK